MREGTAFDDPGQRTLWVETRRDRLALALEAGWGRVSWLSVVAGVLTVFGVFALSLGIAVSIAHALGINSDNLSTSDWKHVGIGAAAGGAVVTLIAYSFGGYVAGRMARRAGVTHGLLVFAGGIVVLAAVVAVAHVENGTSAARDHLRGLGIPTSWGQWATIGTAAGIAALAAMLIGSLAGGVRGERWHERLVTRALDPAIGPAAAVRARQAEAMAATAATAPAAEAPTAETASTVQEPTSVTAVRRRRRRGFFGRFRRRRARPVGVAAQGRSEWEHTQPMTRNTDQGGPPRELSLEEERQRAGRDEMTPR